MMKYYTPILTILFILFFFMMNFSSYAQDQIEDDSIPLSSLAMHGNEKYSPEDAHLDYANPNAPKGGALKFAAGNSTFDTLNPYALKGQAAENIGLIYDRLMRRAWDEPFTMYPLIAEHVEVPQDRSSITFHINPKAKFSDGSAITTADVMFSFETLKENGRPNMRRIYKLVDTVDIKDTQTITFQLGKDYDRETVMILSLMPVLSKEWWKSRTFNQTLTDIPVSSGPYRIKDFEIGRSITYQRDENYWAKDLFINKGHYNFDALTYEYFKDKTIALESFKKGDLSLRREWDVTKWQSAYDLLPATLVKEAIPHQRPERAHGFIFNLRRPPFDNHDVRKALSYAFDEKWVSNNLYHSQFKRIKSVYPNSALDASNTYTAEEFRTPRLALREADKFLQNQGWIIQNKKRVHKDTQESMNIELLVSTAQEEKIALSYQRNLERLGIFLSIRMLDSATFQQRKSSYNYDMISFYWQNSLSPGTEQMLYWSCDSIQREASFNYAGICNETLDLHAKKIANAKSYDTLIAHAHTIDRIIMEQNIMIPLFYNGVDYIAHHKSIRRPAITPLYGAVLETWWMAQE